MSWALITKGLLVVGGIISIATGLIDEKRVDDEIDRKIDEKLKERDE